MNILTKIGISKESIARLLGIHQTVDTKEDSKNPATKRTVRRGSGRPKGLHIPQSVVVAVRKTHKSYTNQEIADKFGVSYYWVWSVRNNRIRK